MRLTILAQLKILKKERPLDLAILSIYGRGWIDISQCQSEGMQ